MLQEDDVQCYVSGQDIKWTFIVELAPWMGGFYERLVGIVKQALRKSLGRKLLIMDQMNTVIKEVESVINRRPLVHAGEDIKSTIALTPCHFLSLNPKTGIPELDYDTKDPVFKPYESTAEKLLQIWKKGEQLLNRFWVLWRDEYLLSLRERSQNKIKSSRIQSHETPSVGDVVIVKDNLPRGQWKLGKVIKLHTSRDGQIRSAQLKVSNRQILRRPLNLLYPIEISGSDTMLQNSVNHDKIVTNDAKEEKPKRRAAEKAKELLRRI
ncbi:uncharacterized protein LOC123538297 [Mercenaria mercenaria]|uniref:uncharacterized protein LOC123538297 n=1 Tax=Mercenaria mercenaria TaxID=6596 RepID=UPI00234F93CC|nr:uncharacterized protein LOC123538297 [Mercenaria mercenaria]